ncbi:WD40 repeat domain-containing protein [Nocardia sp. NPDC051832]|uniref:WD40 repeat domain-containing protein n=1 Tax=Nocardia sp. NPDC051832 TaxID=3155673 RepID=UPI00341D1FE0
MNETAGDAHPQIGLELMWSTLPVTPRHRVIDSDMGVNNMTALPLPDGRTLLALSGTDGIELWDPETAELVAATPATHARENWELIPVRLTNGRTVLVASGVDGVRFWDPGTCLPIDPPLLAFAGDSVPLDAITMSLAAVTLPDGRVRLATGGHDGVVQLWDLDTGDRAGPPVHVHAGTIHGLTAVSSAAGSLFVSAGNDDGVRLWDPETGIQAGPTLEPGSRTQALGAVTLPDGRVALGIAGRDLRLWDPRTRTVIRLLVPGYCYAMCAVPLSGGRAGLAVETQSGLCLWDLSTCEQVGPVVRHDATRMAALPLADGRTLLAAGGDGSGIVRLWDPADFETPVLPPPDATSVHAVAAVPTRDGRTLLAVATGDLSLSTKRVVHLCDPATGAPVGPPLSGLGDDLRVLTAVPSPDGRTLLAVGCRSGDNSMVQMWDLDTGTEAGPLATRFSSDLRSLTSMPAGDGRTALVTAGIRGAQRWDALTGKAIGPMLPLIQPVQSVVPLTLPDGRAGLAAGANNGVHLWDPETGDPLVSPLIETTDPVWALAALPQADGPTLLITGSSRELSIWQPSGDLLTTLPVEWSVSDLCVVGADQLAVAFQYGVALFRLTT